MAAQRKQGQGTTNRGTGTNRSTGNIGGGDAMYALGHRMAEGFAGGIASTLGPNWPAGLTGQNTGNTNQPARAKRGGSRKQSQAQT